MRGRFVERGGSPQRLAPHYFVLGESAWFRGLYRDCAEVRLELAALPIDATSLTWADSIASMGLLAGYGIELPRKPAHGRVFRLDEVDQLVTEFGALNAPAPTDYAGHQRQSFDHFIEVQLWSDEPIRAYLA